MKKLTDLHKKLNNVKLVVFDFDGVFTDNRVIINEDGKESVVCNRSDGLGLSKLKKIGIDCMILSNEINNVVKHRSKKLKVNCINACENKLNKLKELIKKRGISLKNVIYVGNDINDTDCLKAVGIPIVVANAHKDLLKLGVYKTKLGGGQGAVREICDLIYSVRKSART